MNHVNCTCKNIVVTNKAKLSKNNRRIVSLNEINILDNCAVNSIFKQINDFHIEIEDIEDTKYEKIIYDMIDKKILTTSYFFLNYTQKYLNYIIENNYYDNNSIETVWLREIITNNEPKIYKYLIDNKLKITFGNVVKYIPEKFAELYEKDIVQITNYDKYGCIQKNIEIYEYIVKNANKYILYNITKKIHFDIILKYINITYKNYIKILKINEDPDYVFENYKKTKHPIDSKIIEIVCTRCNLQNIKEVFKTNKYTPTYFQLICDKHDPNFIIDDYGYIPNENDIFSALKNHHIIKEPLKYLSIIKLNEFCKFLNFYPYNLTCDSNIISSNYNDFVKYINKNDVKIEEVLEILCYTTSITNKKKIMYLLSGDIQCTQALKNRLFIQKNKKSDEIIFELLKQI